MMFYTVGVAGAVSEGITNSTQEVVSSFHLNILPSTTGIGVGASHKYVDVFFVHDAKGCGGAKPVPSQEKPIPA
jgi:hypothetical protein